MKKYVSIYATLLLLGVALIPLMTTKMVMMANAGEYNEKPVMCGPEEEIFPLIEDKEETLLLAGKQLTKVRDPDENDGIAQNPAVLPFALYVNLDNKTYTVLEYHNAPYNVFCIISYGVELKLGNF